jgi:DNA adenine methylase
VGLRSVDLTGAKPFLKWAGGKSQLLPVLHERAPGGFNKYIEPFVGGGALFLSLLPARGAINDSNEELINAYIVVRDSPLKLLAELRSHVNEDDHYYTVRSLDPSTLTPIERAARFIYLNKTCFNGLHRVNRKGQFNVPFGRYRNPKIADEAVIMTVSQVLQNTHIESRDFETFLRNVAEAGDFVYLDPPYHPVGKYSDFKRYTRDFFGETDQLRLRNVVGWLDKIGCKFMLSNSDAPLMLDLYRDFNIEVVEANRFINCDAQKRGKVNEIVVTNY